MTAQLSLERIEQYANDPRMCNVNEEIRTMARMLLAGMDSEPVAWVMADDLKDKAIISTPAYPSLDDAKDMTIGEIVPLYAAPPAPVAVPDVLLSAMEEVLRISDRDHEAWKRAREGIAACRAAMQAEPVTAANGWTKCSERMPKKGDRILIFIDFNSQAVPPSVHDAEYTGSTFRRGNATVKIYPHEDGFGVTHWMPLPAAPEQEV